MNKPETSSKTTKAPSERTETIRKALLRLLQESSMTAQDLSRQLKIKEKQVLTHLEHIEKSLRRTNQRLQVDPAECLSCGFRFEKRGRLTKPSACPQCRSQHIEPPVFRLA